MARRNPPTAVSGGGEPPYEEEFHVLGDLLHRDNDQIMERWFQRANAEQVHASEKDRKEVMNDLGDMLQVIGRRLCAQSPHAFTEATEIARDHGRQRAHFGWGIVNLVKDYEILHGVVLEYLGETLKDRLTYRQSAVLVAILDRAIGSAVEAFNAMVHERLETENAKQKVEIRELILGQVHIEHRERKQIAESLHDDFQQILVATKIKLAQGIKKVSSDIPDLNEAKALLEEMHTVSRRVTGDLYPVFLESQPFPAAIQRLAQSFQERFDLNVTVELNVAPESDPGPIALRRLLYDTVRELLFNVVKHAQTNQAWVRVCNEGDSIWTFEIEDHGVGFAQSEKAAHAPGHTSLGIERVVNRIQQIGGTMKFDSRGQGTKVVFTVPLGL